jgi:small ligand-binding sensory domain FIST
VAGGGGLHTLGAEQILDAERHARQRADRAFGALLIRCIGRGKRMLGRLDDEGIELPRHRDRGVERFRHFARGEITLAEAVADLGDAEVGDLAHSITFGTA